MIVNRTARTFYGGIKFMSFDHSLQMILTETEWTRMGEPESLRVDVHDAVQ